jgi:hypothetical protein
MDRRDHKMGHANFCPIWPLRPVNWNYRQKRSQDVAHKLLPCLAIASRQLKLWTEEVTRWATQTSALSGHCVLSTETIDRRGHRMGQQTSACLAIVPRQLKLWTEEITRWGTQTSALSGHCFPSTETSDRRGHKMGHTSFCSIWPLRPVNWN